MRHPRLLALLSVPAVLAAQASPPKDSLVLLRPAAVWDGVTDVPHAGWSVLVRGDKIAAVGSASEVGSPKGATVIDLPGTTLMPGLIEAHSHLLLHPYNEAAWNDQVLKEPLALRTARAVNHARNTLMAGWTMVRDLGTEGAGYADVGLKQSIDQGIIPGPRMLVTTRAIVATGSYAPRRVDFAFEPPQGAEEANGPEDVIRVTRDQIAHGADWIKVYADYHWGPAHSDQPTFSQAELDAMVATARDSGRPCVAHAMNPEARKALGMYLAEHVARYRGVTIPEGQQGVELGLLVRDRIHLAQIIKRIRVVPGVDKVVRAKA